MMHSLWSSWRYYWDGPDLNLLFSTLSNQNDNYDKENENGNGNNNNNNNGGNGMETDRPSIDRPRRFLLRNKKTSTPANAAPNISSVLITAPSESRSSPENSSNTDRIPRSSSTIEISRGSSSVCPDGASSTGGVGAANGSQSNRHKTEWISMEARNMLLNATRLSLTGSQVRALQSSWTKIKRHFDGEFDGRSRTNEVVCNIDSSSCAVLPTGMTAQTAVQTRGTVRVNKPCCTGCKNKESVANAHCRDCMDFLCFNCITAHKFMNCFEGHKLFEIDNFDEKTLMRMAEDKWTATLDRLNDCAAFMNRVTESSTALQHASPQQRLAIENRMNKYLATVEHMEYFSGTSRFPHGQDPSSFRPANQQSFDSILDQENYLWSVGGSRHNRLALDKTASDGKVAVLPYSEPLSRPSRIYYDQLGRGVRERVATNQDERHSRAMALNSDDSDSNVTPLPSYTPSAEQVLSELRRSSITGLVGPEVAALIGIMPPQSYIKRLKMTYLSKIYLSKINGVVVPENQLMEPSGVAVNDYNEMFIADTNNHSIRVFSPDGFFKYSFGGCGKRDGQLMYPNCVAIEKRTNDVVVTERNPTPQIQVYSRSGTFKRKFGVKILQHPRGLAVDSNGRIIVIECKVMRVLIFKMDGELLKKISCTNFLVFPNAVCTNDRDEEIMISDNRAHCVRVFNYEGLYLRQIGGEGVTNFPIGVGMTQDGHIVVADNHNNFNLTIFTKTGQMINALESQVKHAQCLDIALLNDGRVVLASKDYRLYIYNYAR